MTYLSTSLRERPIEDTWARLQECMPRIGISRVADITGMDRVGIPVFQAIRPDTNYPNTVFAGKGLRPLESKVSACMEALESFASEHHPFAVLTRSLPQMETENRTFVSPATMGFHLTAPLASAPLEWVEVQELSLAPEGRVLSGKGVWVVKEAVAMPCREPRWRCHTNGIASGNTLEEAILHAAFEVIERDAQSLALAACRARRPAPALLATPSVASLLAAVEKASLKVALKDITSDLEIPTYYAVVWDPQDDSPWYISGGTGCHFSDDIAAVRAITEALQARASMISGAREDLRKERAREAVGGGYLRHVFHYWMSEEGEESRSINGTPPLTVPDALKKMQSALQKKTYDIKWFGYNFDTARFCVVRVLVVGLECFVLDKTRIGERLLKAQPGLKEFRTKE